MLDVPQSQVLLTFTFLELLSHGRHLRGEAWCHVLFERQQPARRVGDRLAEAPDALFARRGVYEEVGQRLEAGGGVAGRRANARIREPKAKPMAITPGHGSSG